MSKIFNILILSVIVNLTSTNVLAQSENGCFMLDANGNPLDLGYLCDNNTKSRTQTIRTPQHNSVSNSESEVFTVPIKRREGGTPVIDVRFNSQHIFEMLVDTGATWTVITSQMAKTLRVIPQGTLTFQTASNNNIDFEVAIIPSVTTGGIISEDLEIAISPDLDIGLLGQNFYGMYDITIKYGVIEFRRR